MAFPPELDALMVDELTILLPSTGKTAYGAPLTHAVVGTYPARYVEKVTRVRDATGDRLATEATAWVQTPMRLSTSYMARFEDKVHAIQAVENYPDEDGHHHSKIMFGWRENRAGR